MLIRLGRPPELHAVKARKKKTVEKASKLEVSRYRSLLYDQDAALPPLVILEAASKSGAMKISPEQALNLLRRYQELEKQRGKRWEEQLCIGQRYPSVFQLD